MSIVVALFNALVLIFNVDGYEIEKKIWKRLVFCKLFIHVSIFFYFVFLRRIDSVNQTRKITTKEKLPNKTEHLKHNGAKHKSTKNRLFFFFRCVRVIHMPH